MAYRQRRGDTLFRFMDDRHRTQNARRIDTDRVDTEPGQEAGDLRIVGGRLPANTDVAVISLCAADRHPEHF